MDSKILQFFLFTFLSLSLGIIVFLYMRYKFMFKQIVKFNHIFEDNFIPALVLDHKLSMVRMNKAFRDVFGKSYDDFISQIILQNGEKIFKNVLEKIRHNDKADLSFEILINDNIKYFKCYLTAFIDGESKFYLVNLIERTDAIVKNQQLEKITQQALELAQKKSEFMACVSHELRTPLNGMIGLSDSLLDSVKDTQNRELVSVIHDSGVHLLQLINNILDFSKLDADKVELESIPVTLEDLSQSVHSTLAEVAKKKGIVLNIEIDDRLPSNLVMDKLRISQVLFNLIGNSIKFTENGSVDLNIKLEKSEGEHHHVLFSIKDTGIGMSQEGLDNLFQAFSQADATISRMYGGTGLGLSISKKIMDLYESHIHVESELGKGSHFYFELKLKEAKNAKVKQDEILEFDGTEIPLKILIAEDNKVNQLVAKKYFAKIGYENIDFAENGKVAFDLAKDNKYDVVFMDMQMPGIDGIEATKMIFDELDFFNAPIVIAMTANSDIDDRKKCMDVGMSDFITKPLNANDIKKVILKHFSQLKKSA